MANYTEGLIRFIYRQWKKSQGLKAGAHPSEEDLACFLEGRLSAESKKEIQKHLLGCDICAEYLAVGLKGCLYLSQDVPEQLLEKVEKLLGQPARENLLEIFLKLKDKAIEIIRTSGDVLVGQELVPAPVLRSRKINDFKEGICVLKDLRKIRVLAKILNKNTESFNLTVTIKDRQGKKTADNLRITLVRDGVELESYIADSAGSSFFENLLPGNYLVEISQEGQSEAALDLRVRA